MARLPYYSVHKIKKFHEEHGGTFFDKKRFEFNRWHMIDFGYKRYKGETYLYKKVGKLVVWRLDKVTGELIETSFSDFDHSVVFCRPATRWNSRRNK